MQIRYLRSGWMAAAIACGILAWTPGIAEISSGGAATVLGANPQLSEGAQAMMAGEWQRGIELTELGLNATVSPSDRAAALANLCAAHAALRQFDRALDFCNQSLAIDETNWETWQNRAACHLGLNEIDESLRDLQRGLALNPDSDSLQKTLAIARDREKLQQERLRHLVES